MGNDLAQRVSAQRNGTDVQTQRPKTLEDQIRAMQGQYQLAMPKGAEAAQLIRDALTAVRNTRNLDKCDPASVLGALMNCAQLGLRPGVLDHAWVLPFWDGKSKGYKAQLIIGYKGYIELGYRTGRIASIMPRTAHVNDLVFDVDYGVNDMLTHKPNMDGPRGDVKAYYTVVKFANGGYMFYVMSKQEALDHRQKYASTRTREGKIFGPWVDNFDGMALKTTVRSVAKYMPKSAELAAAIEVDGGLRLDLNPETSPEDATVRVETDYIDGEVVQDGDSPEPTEADEFAAMQAAMGGGSDG